MGEFSRTLENCVQKVGFWQGVAPACIQCSEAEKTTGFSQSAPHREIPTETHSFGRARPGLLLADGLQRFQEGLEPPALTKEANVGEGWLQAPSSTLQG